MIIINKRELRSSLNIVASCLTYTYVHEFGLRIKIQSKESNFFLIMVQLKVQSANGIRRALVNSD